jgi:hypothetical protein
MDFFYHGEWRMDWGLGNPNKTAALIACLMIAVWAAAYARRNGFWLALPVSTILGCCLVQTYSRGGMVAFLSGVLVLLAWTPRPWPKARWAAVMAAVWIAGLFIFHAKAETRYGQGLFSEDQSIDSRLVIWRHFPQMLAAAPGGWGWGRAGDAYTQWFQPPKQAINYLNLVNSHFTLMAEGGWIDSALYLYGWSVALLICRPVEHCRIMAVALAVWVALGVSACFSDVEESAWLWVLPLVLLVFAMWRRFQMNQWPGMACLGLSALSCSAIVGALILAGCATAALPIKVDGHLIALGSGPQVNIILVDRTVMGRLYGHTFRGYLTSKPGLLAANTFMISESPDFAFPSRIHELIVSGGLLKDAGRNFAFARADRIILINPGDVPENSTWERNWTSKSCVYFGEYSQAPSRSSWAGLSGVRTHLIEGAADFVPSWPRALLQSLTEQTPSW